MKAYSDSWLAVGNQLGQFVLLFILFLAALPAAVLAVDTHAAAKQGKIVFLPFTVKSQPPQDHLRTGLTSVLATRMADRTGLAAVYGADKTGGLEEMLQQGNQQEAKKIIKNMHGDYLLLGNLEQQEQGYEILIHVFRSGKAAPASFSRRIDALDKTIPTLDALADEIATKVFHQKVAEEELPAVADKDGISGFQTSHPDKAYRNGLYAMNEQSTIVTTSVGSGPLNVLNSQNSGALALSLRAMDAGDVDGDGREEIVLLEQGRLILCRFSSDRFQQIAELPLSSYLGLHSVHLADLDNDNRLEIYISASSGSVPSSLVMAWDGKKFYTLHEQVPFYLRPDSDSAGKPVLLGQAGGNIYRISLNRAGDLSRAEEVQVPQGFGLYDFIRIDLDQDGRREFVGLTEENKLLILDQEQKPLWKSEESYGASRDALGSLASRRQAEVDQPHERNRMYLHTRLIAQDITGDGKPEIIVSRNRVTSVKYFKSLRWFEGSSVAVLSWDGSRMNNLWETQQVPGYTVDCQVLRSTEQPGRFRLVAAESDDSGNPLYFWSKEKTIIRMQEMIGKP